MGVSDAWRPRLPSVPDDRTRRAARRLGVRLGVATVGLGGLSGIAGAHDPFGSGGPPVALAVVIGLPVVAGLGGGVLAIRWVRRVHPSTGRVMRSLLAAGLAMLGGSLVLWGATAAPSLGITGGVGGALAAHQLGRSDRGVHRGCHDDLALGAVSAHRLVEGAALGALYGVGTVVSLLGAVVLAGHTAVESAAIGGLYAAGPRRARAIGAVLLVQAGFAGGAVVGLGVAVRVPTDVHALAVALAGGVLVIVGANTIGRAGADR